MRPVPAKKRQSNKEWQGRTAQACTGSHTFLIDGSWLLQGGGEKKIAPTATKKVSFFVAVGAIFFFTAPFSCPPSDFSDRPPISISMTTGRKWLTWNWSIAVQGHTVVCGPRSYNGPPIMKWKTSDVHVWSFFFFFFFWERKEVRWRRERKKKRWGKIRW